MACRILSVHPEETGQKYISLRREQAKLSRESDCLYNDCLILNNKMDIYEANLNKTVDVSVLKIEMFELRLKRIALNERWIELKTSYKEIEDIINETHKDIFNTLINPISEPKWLEKGVSYEDRKFLYDISKKETSWKKLAEASILFKELMDCIY
jgi:hypothetical protein